MNDIKFKKGDKVQFTSAGAKKYKISPKLKKSVFTVTKVNGVKYYSY